MPSPPPSAGRRPARGARLLVLVLLFIAPLSGCLGGPSPSGAPGGPGGNRPSEGGVGLDRGKGAIHGTVLNPEGAWISGAHVLVVGGSFLTSDYQGRFAFVNLAPGLYTVRASADDYAPVEQVVPVEPDAVVPIDLVLSPAQDLGADYRYHFHDRWQGQARLELFNGTVSGPPGVLEGGTDPLPCEESGSGVSTEAADADENLGSTNQQEAGTGGCGIVFYLGDADGDGNEEIVPPGTKELEVQIAWRSDQNYAPRAGFGYKPANRTSGFLGPVTFTPGQVQTVPVDANMTDHGHELYSLWRFGLDFEFTLNGIVALPKQPDLVHELVGDFTVRIVAVKGTLPPEPPHPRFWAHGPRLELLPDAVHTLVQAGTIARDPTQVSDDGVIHFVLPGEKIVPPGTTELEIALAYWTSTPVETVKDLDEVLSEKTLAFRSTRINPRLATFDDLRTDSGTSTPPRAGAHGRVAWSLPIEDDETDAVYQKSTRWLFLAANKGDEREEDFVNECLLTRTAVPASACDGLNLQVRVTAVNGNWKPALAGTGATS